MDKKELDELIDRLRKLENLGERIKEATVYGVPRMRDSFAEGEVVTVNGIELKVAKVWTDGAGKASILLEQC